MAEGTLLRTAIRASARDGCGHTRHAIGFCYGHAPIPASCIALLSACDASKGLATRASSGWSAVSCRPARRDSGHRGRTNAGRSGRSIAVARHGRGRRR